MPYCAQLRLKISWPGVSKVRAQRGQASNTCCVRLTWGACEKELCKLKSQDTTAPPPVCSGRVSLAVTDAQQALKSRTDVVTRVVSSILNLHVCFMCRAGPFLQSCHPSTSTWKASPRSQSGRAQATSRNASWNTTGHCLCNEASAGGEWLTSRYDEELKVSEIGTV